MCLEVCTTNFGNLNRPHFSSQILTKKIANQAKYLIKTALILQAECDAYMLKLQEIKLLDLKKYVKNPYKSTFFR